MKYTLILSAILFCSCANSEADQRKEQTQQVNRNIEKNTTIITGLIKERNEKINVLVRQGKTEEAAAVGREYNRKMDSVSLLKD